MMGLSARTVGLIIRSEFKGVLRYPLTGQLDEAVRIGMVEGHGKVLGDRSEGVGGHAVVLNRKDEHYQPRVVHYSFYT